MDKNDELKVEKKPLGTKKRVVKIPLAAKIVIAVLVLILLFRLFDASISRKKNIATERVYSVATVTIEPQILQEYFRVNGDVMAENTINIIPDIGGKLVQYTVSVGQKVARNQVIAYVDPSKPGMVYSLSPVRAPLAGTITSLPIELGNTVSVSSIVAYMGDLSKLKIETYIPERFVRDLSIGTKAFLSLSGYPGKEYPASVADLSPVVDPLSRTVWAKLYVDQPSSDLMAGMFGGLRINTITHDNAMVVPSSSVIIRSGKNYLAKLGRSRSDVEIKKNALTAEGLRVADDFEYFIDIVEVELGPNVDGMVLVLNGINIGDQIVVAGQNVLSQDSKVKLLATMMAKNDGTLNNEESEAPNPDSIDDLAE